MWLAIRRSRPRGSNGIRGHESRRHWQNARAGGVIAHAEKHRHHLVGRQPPGPIVEAPGGERRDRIAAAEAAGASRHGVDQEGALGRYGLVVDLRDVMRNLVADRGGIGKRSSAARSSTGGSADRSQRGRRRRGLCRRSKRIATRRSTPRRATSSGGQKGDGVARVRKRRSSRSRPTTSAAVDQAAAGARRRHTIAGGPSGSRRGANAAAAANSDRAPAIGPAL